MAASGRDGPPITGAIRKNRAVAQAVRIFSECPPSAKPIVGVFPEGMRSGDGMPLAAASGAAWIARRCEVPIVPVALCGFHDAWPPSSLFPLLKQRRISMHFLPVLDVNDFANDQEAIDVAMARVVVSRLRALRVLVMYVAYLVGFSSDAYPLRRAGFAILAGISEAKLQKHAECFVCARFPRYVRAFAPKLVEHHKSEGHHTVLVTSAAEMLARPVADFFKIEAVVSTTLVVQNGVFTGDVELPEPYASGKQDMVRKYCARNAIDPSACHAYSDHQSDLPVLESVGHPTAVNPTRRLHYIAARRGWKILDLEKRLFSPVPNP